MSTTGAVLTGIAVILLVFVLILGGMYVAGFFQRTQLDINRENTQHSQQYIETKRSLLNSLIADAEAANGAQREAVLSRFCDEYSYVDFDVPQNIHQYALANC